MSFGQRWLCIEGMLASGPTTLHPVGSEADPQMLSFEVRLAATKQRHWSNATVQVLR
jgi:hypothetical protein